MIDDISCCTHESDEFIRISFDIFKTIAICEVTGLSVPTARSLRLSFCSS